MVYIGRQKKQDKVITKYYRSKFEKTHIDIDSCKLSQKKILCIIKGDAPKKGDILFSKDGTVGICFAFKHAYNIDVLSSIAIIRPNPQSLHSDFGAYALKSSKVLWQIIEKTGTALRRIILNDLKTVKIPLLPFEE